MTRLCLLSLGLALCLLGCGFSQEGVIPQLRGDAGPLHQTENGRLDPHPFDAGFSRNTDPDRFDAGRASMDAAIDAGPRDAGAFDAAVDASRADATAPSCSDGYEWVAARHSCVDIDECAYDNGGCGDATLVRCNNQPGALQTCEDIDECVQPGACDGYECHNQYAAAPTCELACPPDSSDVHGDGALCLAHVRQFDLSYAQGCALLPSGALRCFRAPASFNREGRADFVQLDSFSSDLSNVCGLHADGTLSCWGSLTSAVQDASGLRQIAVGYRFVCALTTSDDLRCWGTFSSGAAPTGDAARFSQIDANSGRVCGIHHDGTPLCWGSTTPDVAAINAEDRTDFTQISVGGFHTCALHANGSIQCWSTTTTGPADDRVSGPNADSHSDYIQISAGSYHSCGLHADGTLTCWGLQSHDEVSGPNSDAHPPFVRVQALNAVTCGFALGDTWRCWGTNEQSGFDHLEPLPSPKAVRFVGAGCVRRTDDSVYCSGDYQYQPGAAEALNANGGKNFVAAARNDYGVCGLGTDGRLQCWAETAYYMVDVLMAPMVADPRNRDWVTLTTLDDSWCGRRSDESFDCLSLGSLDGTEQPDEAALTGPLDDGGPFIDFVGDGAFPGHSCGIHTDGRIKCWGADEGAAWIAGPNADTAHDFVQLALAQNVTCALHGTGSIQCWANDNGRLSAISADPRADFTKVVTSGVNVCGLRRDGSLTCRGDDAYGQTSSANTTAYHDFVDLSFAENNTCALRPNGSMLCWGSVNIDTGALILASRP